MRRIGWIAFAGTPGLRPSFVEALRELGWVEGRNLAVEQRHADGQRERLAALAKELAAADVDLIVAVAPTAILATSRATSSVPIVMAWWGGPDLVAAGVIASYARPGGNITGVDMLLSALDAKRLDLLREAVPAARKIAVLIHNQQLFEPQLPAVRELAARSGLTLEVVDTRDGAVSYAEAFDSAMRLRCQALLVMSSPLFGRDRRLIVEQAARVRLPAMHPDALAVAAGGLMAYGTTLAHLDQLAARQVDRILRGAKPAELPVEQPSRYELAVNLKTARDLGLTMPRALLLRADQVIE
jgi:putative ABC transport system substrate-binding protein